MSEQTLDKRTVNQTQSRRKAATDELYMGGLASFSLNRVAEADPEDIQSVGASNLCLLESFYTCVRNQSDESFRWAVVAASVGCVFFLFAVAASILIPIWLPDQNVLNITTVSLLSGAIVEVIAGLNFYLYGRTSAQLASFHVYLDRTQRYLLANSVCEKIKNSEEGAIRAELVRMIASSPMYATEEQQATVNKTTTQQNSG